MIWTDSPAVALCGMQSPTGDSCRSRDWPESPSCLSSQEGRLSVATPTQEEMIEDFEWFDEWTDEAGSDIVYWSLGSECPEISNSR